MKKLIIILLCIIIAIILVTSKKKTLKMEKSSFNTVKDTTHKMWIQYEKSDSGMSHTEAKEVIPDFNFALITGDTIRKADLDKTKHTLMLFFNSECDYCIKETKAITDSAYFLDNCQILMITFEDSIKVANFYHQFSLSNYQNIRVAYAKADEIAKKFKIYIAPTLYVYNPDHSLLKYKPGPVSVRAIVKYLYVND
jgi:peroxiredoxin